MKIDPWFLVCPDINEAVCLRIKGYRPLSWQLFDKSAPRWAWYLLAKPSRHRDAEDDFSLINQRTLRPSTIEQLPMEILDIIMKDPCVSRLDILAFGLSSPVFWPLFLRFVYEKCMQVSAPWADKGIACVERKFLPNRRSESLRPNSPEASDWKSRSVSIMARTGLSKGPASCWSTEARLWELLASRHLATPRAEHKTGKGFHEGGTTQVIPAKAMEDCTLYASVLRSLMFIGYQALDQPWLLRNQPKLFFVRLDPQNCGQAAAKSELLAKPPRLSLRHGKVEGSTVTCTCAVSAEDILLYHIFLPSAEHPAWKPLPGYPSLQGDWVGDSFDIVAQGAHQTASLGETWTDRTADVRIFFADMIKCDEGRSWGHPRWKETSSTTIHHI